MSGRSSNSKTPPQQPPVDPAQREQAIKFMQMLAGNRQQEYTPILKSLKQIGVEPKSMTVMVGDEPTDCLVIPLQELMSKEWAHMSGQESNTEQENS